MGHAGAISAHKDVLVQPVKEEETTGVGRREEPEHKLRKSPSAAEATHLNDLFAKVVADVGGYD